MHGLTRRRLLAAGGSGLAVLPAVSALARQVTPARAALALDELALAIWRSAPVRAAGEAAVAALGASANAAFADARALIPAAVAEHAFAAAQIAANEDVTAPRLQWVMARAHRHGRLAIPAGRYGVENPDNVYRLMPLDPARRYRLSGRLAKTPPTAFTFSVMTGQFMESLAVKTDAILTSRNLLSGRDGRFEITVGPEGAAGRPNHIQVSPAARILFLRETMGDWATQLPAAIRVECLDPEPRAPAPGFAALCERAAGLIASAIKAWPLTFQHGDYDRVPVNTVGPLIRSSDRAGGLVSQMSAHGLFQLGEDEALVVRVPDMGARYIGFELADPWMVSAEYGTRSGSLNNTQALADADGGRTYVIAPRDPGVYNWADPGPIRRGSISIRIQDFDPARAQGAHIGTRLVNAGRLREALPAGTVAMTRVARLAQLARRQTECQRRVSVLEYGDRPELSPSRWRAR